MSRIFAAVVVIVVIVVASVVAQAQTPILAGRPFDVQADHDGVNTLGYRVYVDEVRLGSDVPLIAARDPTTGVVRLGPYVLAASGDVLIRVAAYNDTDEERSLPTLIRVVDDGGVEPEPDPEPREVPRPVTGLRLR